MIGLDRHRPRNYTAVLGCAIGLCFLIMVPLIHLGVINRMSFFSNSKAPVDVKNCKCDCWDTYYKGPYQKGSPGYKHIYFNITSTSLKIWTMTMLAVVLLYETVKFIFSLVVTGNLRLPMFILLASVFYSHYYSWWVFFNYWNDGFFRQWNHQVFFTLTELLSTGFVLYLCNTKNSCGPRHLLPILTIAVVHIVTSSVDQFLHNVLLGKGLPHQIPRDIALMVPDQLHVFIPLWEILRHSKANNIPLKYMFTQAELIASLLGGISMYLVCSSL